jgi:hypothetical protein
MTNSLDYPAVRRGAVARPAADLDDVFRLRYLCYQCRGAIAEREDRRFRDSFDDLPNQFSYLVRDQNEEALATVRISVIRPDGVVGVAGRARIR